ncbi:MAG: hypothetical protein AB7U75_04825 [Hyphomicrobiaceae bacterium]
MRYSASLAMCTIGVSVVAVAQARPIESLKALFQPNHAGCLAANAGALDLHVKVSRSGDDTGQYGSGLVSGFRQGDMLLIYRNSSDGQPLLDYTLAALNDLQIAPVLSLDRTNASISQISLTDQVKFVIPPEGTGWALFSNTSTPDGEGEYAITVRCVPGDNSSPPPIS